MFNASNLIAMSSTLHGIVKYSMLCWRWQSTPPTDHLEGVWQPCATAIREANVRQGSGFCCWNDLALAENRASWLPFCQVSIVWPDEFFANAPCVTRTHHYKVWKPSKRDHTDKHPCLCVVLVTCIFLYRDIVQITLFDAFPRILLFRYSETRTRQVLVPPISLSQHENACFSNQRWLTLHPTQHTTINKCKNCETQRKSG